VETLLPQADKVFGWVRRSLTSKRYPELTQGGHMKTIVNLTELEIIEEIETVVETYPHHPYQQVFAIPELRQELMAYVLSHTNNRYVVVEEGQEEALRPLPCSKDQRLSIEELIRQGIEKTMQKNMAQIAHQIPEPVASSSAPSSWFG
jgi:hypothetical protein